MPHWTNAAEEELDRYLERVRCDLLVAGDGSRDRLDALERDLRRRFTDALRDEVTIDDVRELIERISDGEPDANPLSRARPSPSRWFSFRRAASGILQTILSEQNARIEIAAGSAAIALGWILHVTTVEKAILALTVFSIIALEHINTAIEHTVDIAPPGIQPLARAAKDAAGGAVLVAVIGSVFVAAAIFAPRLLAPP